MKTLIKLTSQGNPVLINFDNVVEVSPVQGGTLSRVNFVGGNYKIVEESMESIMQIVEEVSSGGKQEIDWTFQTPSVDESFQQTFQPRYPQPQRQQRSYPKPRYERNFNNYNSYNQNNY
jgi:hypothetical protein